MDTDDYDMSGDPKEVLEGRLERVEAEYTKLQEERDELADDWASVEEALYTVIRERDKALAECARLQEALEQKTDRVAELIGQREEAFAELVNWALR